MSGFQPINWNYSLNPNYKINRFEELGLDIIIYTNYQYDDYLTWLNSDEILDEVREFYGYLKSSTLFEFQNLSSLSYDGLAIHVNMQHEFLDIKN